MTEDIEAQLAELRDQLGKLEAVRELLGDEAIAAKRAELDARIDGLVQTGGGAACLSGGMTQAGACPTALWWG